MMLATRRKYSKKRFLWRLVIGLTLVISLTYLALVTPARFLQCIDAPYDYILRFEADNYDALLPVYSQGNSAKLLVNGDEILPTLLEEIRRAESSIRWQVLLFEPDEAGQEIAATLIEAAKRGVKVQISFNIHQSINGSFLAPYSSEKRLRFESSMNNILQGFEDAGIDVINNEGGISSPSITSEDVATLQREIAQSACISFNHIDHRKLMIFDSKTAVVGSFNVANRYLYHIPTDKSLDMRTETAMRQANNFPEAWDKWNDTAVIVRGEILESIISEFDLTWQLLGGTANTELYQTISEGDLQIQALRQHPGRAEISTSYYSLIREAKSEILIANPYIAHDGILNALIDASNRGVQVIIVTPSTYNDVSTARRLFTSRTKDLMEAGILIYENSLRMQHTKIMLVDSKITNIGSLNLNHRSIDHDLEFNLVIEDSEFAARIHEKVFNLTSEEYTKLLSPYPFGRSPIDWLIQPFT